jgi:GT2 family glycosyltransferase
VVEKMVEYMEAHSDVGLVGPRLLNMNETVQESVYQFMTPEIALYRRTPLGYLPFAKRRLQAFLMKDINLHEVQEVDWVLGAALFFSAQKAQEIGHLDEDMFLYLSDTYFAWEMWEHGYKVVYFPEVALHHYHRKESREYFFLRKLLFNKAYRIHIRDGIQYFLKTIGKPNPRTKK